MGDHPAVFQITGFKNSGKTTLVDAMIAAAEKRGLRIGVIKHHGHGGSPASAPPEKDSERHFNRGAAVSSVLGGGVLQLSARAVDWGLDELLPIYTQFPLDVILIEGFKQAAYPKVVMVRGASDLVMLAGLKQVRWVVSDRPEEAGATYPEAGHLSFSESIVRAEDILTEMVMSDDREKF